MKVDIAQAQPWLRPFPDPSQIFDESQPWLDKHFHVLSLIDLGFLEHLGKGWLPLLSPIEPYEGYPGDFTAHPEDPYASPNWLSFELLNNGRLRFLGERGWFALESVPTRSLCESTERELLTHYAAQEASFQHARTRYERYGVLCRGARFDPESRPLNDSEPIPMVCQLGGRVGTGNWAVCPDPPSAFTLDRRDVDDVFPVSADGKRFSHVASVPGWHWRDAGADLILLFYEPCSRRLLMTFDWT